jgi:hypothetical protein
VGLLYLALLKAKLPVAHNYLEGYLGNFSRIDVRFLLDQAAAMWSGWQQLWGSIGGAVIAVVLVIPGLAIRLRRIRVDAWYVLISFGMLVVWPFPGQMGRFLWILMPAFVLAALTTCEWISDRACSDFSARRSRWAGPAI